MKKRIFINSIAVLLLASLFSCRNHYQTKKDEMREIQRIFRGFTSIETIFSSCCNTQAYNFTPNILDTANSSYKSYSTKEFNQFLLQIEGLENASSKLYLDSFVYFINYNKEKDELDIWFNDTSGASYQDGKWIEVDNSHSLFSNWF